MYCQWIVWRHLSHHLHLFHTYRWPQPCYVEAAAWQTAYVRLHQRQLYRCEFFVLPFTHMSLVPSAIIHWMSTTEIELRNWMYRHTVELYLSNKTKQYLRYIHIVHHHKAAFGHIVWIADDYYAYQAPGYEMKTSVGCPSLSTGNVGLD